MSILSRLLAGFLAGPVRERIATSGQADHRSEGELTHAGRRIRRSASGAGHWRQSRSSIKRRKRVQRGRGVCHVESLEERYLLAVAVELNGGLVPSFTGDAADDALMIRVGTVGKIEYSANGSAFSNDLDSDAGIQSLTISSANRIDANLGSGNDTLIVDFSGGNPLPANGVAYQAGSGIDQIVVTADKSFVLSDGSLTIVAGGIVSLVSVEQARLTGGDGANSLDASTFTYGSVTLDGGAGNDTIWGGLASDSLIGGVGTDRLIQNRNTSQTLSNTVVAGMGTDAISGFEEASLVGGPANNVLDAATFSGSVTLDGGAGFDSLIGGMGSDYLSGGPGDDMLAGGLGTDTVLETADVDFILADNALTGLGTDSLAGIEQAQLTGGAGTNIFTLSNWSGQATLDGGGASDRIVTSKDVNFVLTQTLLSLSSGPAISLSSIEEAQLQGGAGNNTLNASEFAGPVTLDGGSGNDSLAGGSGDDELTGQTGSDTLDGGAGTDTLAETSDSGLTLSNTSLTGIGGDVITRFEQARLTGGPSNNRLDASSFSGPVSLDGGQGNDTLVAGSFGSMLTGGPGSNTLIGGAGTDTVVEVGDVNFVLSAGKCSGPGVDLLTSLERVRLSGGPGANSFTVSGWTGSATLDGGLGTDRIISSNDSNFTLTDTELSRASGGVFTLAGMEAAQLTGGAGANSLDASAFTLGSVTLDGAGGNDTLMGGTRSDVLKGGTGTDSVVAAGDVSFTLTNATLNGLGSDTLSGIEQASVTGGPGANWFTVSGWTGQATLDGAAGMDRLISSNNTSFLLNDTTFTQSNGGSFLLRSIDQAVLTGTSSANSINASDFSGSTTLTGGAGNDTISGGLGIDTLIEQGNVNLTLSNWALTGGLGSDALSGIERAVLTGGPGNNTLDATLFSGTATLDGGDGADSIASGSGTDFLTGGPNGWNDTVIGGAGVDTVVETGDANFTITASSLIGLGTDTMSGIEQARLTGGASPNVFTVTSWTGAATLDGGAADDQIVASNDANFTLTDSVMTRSGTNPVVLVGIEQAKLTGGASANLIDAAAFSGATTLDGAAGSDTLLGGSGPDQLIGGSGSTNDTISGGAGTDTLIEVGNVHFTLSNTLLTGLGTDPLSGIERAKLTGGSNGNLLNASNFTAGPVTLDGGSSGDTLIGGTWSDVLTGGGGSDNISGGPGVDTVWETADSDYTLSDTVLSGNGTDTLASIEQAELIGGSSSNVFTVSGWSSRATVDGGTGEDRIVASGDAHFALNDTQLMRSTGGSFVIASIEQANLTGGAGPNQLDASGFSGNVTLDGGSGNDTILGAMGNDNLLGNTGTDRLIAWGDVNFTLSASGITGLGTDTQSGFEEVLLTGGESDNVFTVSTFAVQATLDGGSGTDQIAASDNASFTLVDGLLSRSSGGTFTLIDFEQGRLTGGSGANTLTASGFTGPVTLDGGSGADSLVGGSGDDQITGGSGGSNNDTVNGGPGIDTLVETSDTNLTLTNTTLTGLGNDSLANMERAILTGGSNGKTIHAAAFTLGAVTINGGGGGDSITGGSGDDVLSGNLGSDTINGGPGVDTIVESADVSFVLSNTSLSGLGNDGLISIERAVLTGGNSSGLIDASAYSVGPVTLDGGLGNDILKGGSAGCVLIGGPGNDALTGGSAPCTFTGGLGDDSISGGASVADSLVESADVNFTLTAVQLTGLGNDVLNGIDTARLTGGPGANTIQASGFSQGAVTLDGAGGDDTIIGGELDDCLVGGDGNDSVLGQDGDDSLSGGLGDDTLDGGMGLNVLVESADVDFTLTTTTLDGLGADALASISSADLTGGPGKNRLDTVRFWNYAVTLRGGAGNDTLHATSGTDTLDGGAGDDTFIFHYPTGSTHSIEDADGVDLLDFSDVNQAVYPSGPGIQLNLGQTTAQTVIPSSSFSLTLASGSAIENVVGTWASDSIVGNALGNTILASNGNDTIDGASGNDAIYDGVGHDNVSAGLGNDTVYSVEGDDTVLPGDGSDTRYSALGDFNGDARRDAVGRDLTTGQWFVNLSTNDGPVVKAWGWSNPAVNWDDVQVGDFNGDGRDDLAARDTSGSVQVALSTGSGFQIESTWAAWDSSVNWLDTRVGDFNGDGLDDLVARNGSSGDLQLSLSLGTAFGTEVWGRWDPSNSTMVDVQIGDFNGDGRADLAARNVWPGTASQDGTWQVALNTGSSFNDQNWGLARAGSDIEVTDVGGDGLSDIIGYRQNVGWWTAISTGSAFVNQSPGPFITTSATTTFGVTTHSNDARLAAALDAFEWVRNYVEYEPYPGLMKGARATEETRAGNDWDQAALLVERLAESGIDASIVAGSIKFQGPEQFQQLQDWLGVTQFDSALNVLGQAGLHPSTTLYFDRTISDITIDHAWVQASLPGPGGTITRNLDPSWKFKDYQTGMPDIVAQVPFDKAGFLAQPRPEIAYEYYQNQVVDYLARNRPGVSLGEIPHNGPIIVQPAKEIPIAPNYTIAYQSSRYDSVAEIPGTQQHRVRLTLAVTGGAQLLQQTLLVPNVSLSRITISYSIGPSGSLAPELRIDGNLIASGAPVADSAPVELTVAHLDPGDDAIDQSFTYRRKAGQYLAVGLNAHQISDQQLIDARRSLNDAILSLNGEPADPGEPIAGGTLSLAMMKYFHDVSQQADLVSDLTHAKSVYKRVGSGIATSDRQASYHWDLQIPVIPQGMGVDIPNNVYEPVPLHDSSTDFSSPDQRTRLDIVGYTMSGNEHAVLEEIINTESISTVKGIQLAHASGMPVSTFIPGNANDISTTLDLTPEMEQSVESAVNGGFTVMVPQQPIVIHDWTGAVFIQENVRPDSFSLGYIIEDDLITQGGAATTPNPDLEPPVPKGALSQQYSAGDPVNPSNGNMFRDETDISLPGIGLPLQFTRHYDSQFTVDLGLGTGWLHGYSDSLSFAANGDVAWLRSDGTRHTFEAIDQGNYRVPDTLHGTFIFSGNVYTFRNKDGLKHEFDSRGRLIDIADRNGNKLLINRDSFGRIDTVSDAFDPTRRLTFDYSADQLTSVQDFTGRTWTYSHQTMISPWTNQLESFLSRVAGPTDAQTAAAIVQYRYYNGGRLHGLMEQITEPDGSGHHYSYYPNRRAFEVTDALGHSTAMSYNLFRSMTTFLDERAAATTYEYDDSGLLVKQIGPDGSRNLYTWQNFLMQSATDPFGNTETYAFYPDGLGNLKQTTSRDGLVTEFTYEPVFSNVTSIMLNPGPQSELTQFTYDTNGNVTQIVDAVENKTTMSYSGCSGGPRGLVCARTEPKGNVPAPDGDYTKTFTYNNAGQVLTVTTGLPSQVVNSYDSRGNLISTTDPTGIQTHYTYDLIGRRLSTALPDPDGTGPLGALVTTTSYDPIGRPVAITDPNGNRTTLRYNLKGDQVQTVRADGTSVRYERDEVGNQIAAVDELGRQTEWVYDNRNRPVAVIHPDGSFDQTRYDVTGRVVATIDPLGNETQITYDPVGRVLTTTDALGNITVNTYDMFGNLKATTNRLGGTIDYRYDPLNRATQVRGPDGFVSTTDYDPNGNVIRQVRYDFTGLGNIPEDPRTLPTTLQRVEQTVYDIAGRPIRHLDPLNSTSSISYDAAGRVKSRQDELGRVTTTNYDAAGRVIQQIAADPDGPGPRAAPVTNYTLDAVGNVLITSDPLNRATTFLYDRLNRPVARFNAEDSSNVLSYDPVGQITSAQDEAGRITLYSYDPRGRRTRQFQSDPDWTDRIQVGPRTIWSYDAAGHVLSELDPLGRVTQFEYDALGQRTLQKLPDPDGAGHLPAPFATSAYDAEGNLVRAGDHLLRTTVTINDMTGRAVQIISPDPDAAGPLPAPVQTATFDALGNQIRSADTLGRTAEYKYDALGRQTRVTLSDPDGAGPLAAPTTLTSYDLVGNVSSVTDPLGHTTTYQYDGLNRRKRETSPDPDGAGPLIAPFTTFAYDAVGNLTSSTNALGETTQHEYDSLNRITRVTDPRLAVIVYSYDSVGNRTRITDPALNETTFAFDRLNRVIRETNALGASESFTYDAAGNRLTVTDRNGAVRQFSYDALKRPTAEQWMQGSTIVRTINTSYDAAGRLQSVSDPDSTIMFSYDTLDRPIIVSNSGTAGAPPVLWNFTYDAAGNKVARSETINGQPAATTTYSFDDLNRMTRVEQSGTGVAAKRVDLNYNALGQFVSLTRSTDLAGTQIVAQSNFGYDQTNRLASLSHARGATALATYIYQFDAANRIMGSTSNADSNGSSNYTYDAAGQLIAATHTFQSNENYSYDAAGNRTNSGYQTGTNNRLNSDGMYTYAYDAQGNRVRRIRTATGEYNDYTWDERNRLIRVATQSAEGTIIQQVDYKYDALDRRIARTVDVDGSGPGAAFTEYFIFDDDDVTMVFRDPDGSGPEPAALQSRFLHGPAVDQILADESTSQGLLWPLTDHEGTVRDLVKRVATATEVANHVVYDSFGRVISESGPAVDHLYSYTGRERDEATGLMNYRARWYDPAVGRFLSEDPAGFDAGDSNLARYVANNPVNATDPSGMTLTSPLASTFSNLESEVATLSTSMPGAPYSYDRIAESVGPELLARSSVDSLEWSERLLLERYVRNHLEVPDPSTGWPGPSPSQLERLSAARNPGLVGWLGQFTGLVETEQLVLADIQREKNQWASQQLLNWSQRQNSDAHPLIQYFQLNSLAAQPLQSEIRQQLMRPLDATLAVATLAGLTLEARAARTAMAEMGAADRLAGGIRAMKLPQINPALAGTGTAGETTMDGRVFLKPGLARVEQALTLRHESVHSFLTPQSGPFVEFRQRLSHYGYANSAFLQGTEEMMAHTYATGSLREGILHPFSGSYWVRNSNTTVTPGLYLAEGAGVVTTVGATAYGANRLGKRIWKQKP